MRKTSSNVKQAEKKNFFAKTKINGQERTSSLLAWRHMLHFNASLSLEIRGAIFPFLWAQSLVTRFVWLLEFHIRRWARPEENRYPVPDNIALSKRTVSIWLDEFVRIQVFARRLATANQEKMVYPKGSRVGSGQRSVDHHSPGHSQDVDGRAEGNTLTFFVHQNVRKTGTE